ncbi:MAG: hypothetical protein A3G46_01805 [Candidatus Zambryskibacteria bacterium RIFCSPLOWO2_12_FULL_39_16]|uniref:DUF2933 domain-containing protein n=1 Tax=Candidatus Zambryskibacteria bacterium RIFCSPLOWO2_12_FULL_39_16 TaxID=1802775 RepID=A0A1G2UUA4_9BACT|nr:MAG: hypothetical protein A3I19_02615 [Candidatus Zambryskibacteria bacterium RIFCSPLOWO2_02_FULL_38_13]OHB12948.1 MAG: hypothetical protein A3G46_01805 [Candidatus Zambryskibacteria bacterium RIFCSPLOWO2_12_FULL_39_16]
MKNKNIQPVLISLLVIIGIYLVVDHGQHLVPYLPFAFLLGCLSMHLFMHHGHGSHSDKDHHEHN